MSSQCPPAHTCCCAPLLLMLAELPTNCACLSIRGIRVGMREMNLTAALAVQDIRNIEPDGLTCGGLNRSHFITRLELTGDEGLSCGPSSCI